MWWWVDCEETSIKLGTNVEGKGEQTGDCIGDGWVLLTYRVERSSHIVWVLTTGKGEAPEETRKEHVS